MSGNKVAPEPAEKQEEEKVKELSEEKVKKDELDTEKGTTTKPRKWYDPGFPPSIYLIVTSEFCERFTFYGMRAILMLYLLNGLLYDSATSVTIYHAFVMFVYFTPIFGGIVADVWWGKYLTIVVLSIVYAIGNCSIAFTSFEGMEMVVKQAGCFIGLALIAIGTGGIKPCVSGFGADQIPESEPEVRSRYFSAYYFAVNSGSLVSTLLTPYLRTVDCGGGACFPLAFGVPAGLMVIAIILFLLGTPLYKREKPQGNILYDIFKCITHAIANWWKMRKTDPKNGLLDYADDQYSEEFITNIRNCKSILVMLLPSMIFWALFDQHGSTWTLQAQRMDGTLGTIYVLPDQIKIINPALILIMIPLFEAFIYPLFMKCNLFMPTRLLQRMVVGLFFSALSFFAATVVMHLIEPNAYKDPPAGYGWLHVVNLDPYCNISTTYGGLKTFPFMYNDPNYNRIPVLLSESPISLNVTYSGATCSFAGQSELVTDLHVAERNARTLFHSQKQYINIKMPDPYKDSIGPARLKWIIAPATISSKVKAINVTDGTHTWGFYPSYSFQTNPTGDTLTVVPVGDYSYTVSESQWATTGLTQNKVAGLYHFGVDSVTSMIVYYADNAYHVFPVQELPAKLISSFWMLPQYFLITVAEILYSISGLNFAYSQAPANMRSVFLAYWYLMVAFGNLIVLVVSEILKLKPAGMSLFYTVLALIAGVIFAIMTLFYKYVEPTPATKPRSDSESSTGSADTPPPAYKDGLVDEEGLPVEDPAQPEVQKYRALSLRHQEHIAHQLETVVTQDIDVADDSTPKTIPANNESDSSADAPAASAEARAASPEARAASPKARAASPEARAASPKARAASPEARAASPKARAASPEARPASANAPAASAEGTSAESRV